MEIPSIQMYSPSVVEASKSVLIELSRCLSSYKDHLVLAGGWAPYFILEKFGQRRIAHCGSIDVDFILNSELVTERVYETIVETITKRGYEPARDESGKEIPFKFYRRVKSPLDGEEHKIPVDFLTEPVKAKKFHAQLLRVQKDLQAVIIPGCNIVFSHNFRHLIQGTLPDGGKTGAPVNIADIVGSLTMKGLALQGRYKEKDCYDIYYLLKFFKGGPARAAQQVKKHLTRDIKRAVHAIKEKFRTQRSEGPYQVARFVAPANVDQWDKIRANVHITVRKFFVELRG